jgi:hypothetical protein
MNDTKTVSPSARDIAIECHALKLEIEDRADKAAAAVAAKQAKDIRSAVGSLLTQALVVSGLVIAAGGAAAYVMSQDAKKRALKVSPEVLRAEDAKKKQDAADKAAAEQARIEHDIAEDARRAKEALIQRMEDEKTREWQAARNAEKELELQEWLKQKNGLFGSEAKAV